ncbi:MAG: hypothetical protein L6408_01020, partial [Nanoarchaeota archaeon]|nr:hypothetical protein [Nanoarchaeota archaeon]
IFFISGCAANPYILRSRQKALNLDENKGMVLFTVEADFPLSMYNYTIQEVNQYKLYKQLRPIIIPCVNENYNARTGIFLYSLILPGGTYKLTHFFGYTTSPSCAQFSLFCNKVVDVHRGIIAYAGRLKFDSAAPGCYSSISGVKDFYHPDIEVFRNHFPILKDKEIIKDPFY